MVRLVVENLDSIGIIISTLMVIFILFKMGKRDLARQIILSIVVQAEKSLGSGTGELKYAFVIDKIYNKSLKIISLLYSKKEINYMIEEAVKKLKEILTRNINLSGYDDELYIDTLCKKEEGKDS